MRYLAVRLGASTAISRFALAFLLALAGAHELHAQPDCHVDDFRGVYGAMGQGEFFGGPQVGPIPRISRVEADGAGGLRLKSTFSNNGVILRDELVGIYSVNPDCSMLITLTLAGLQLGYAGGLADHSRTRESVLISPEGSNLRIELREQHKATCSDQDLNGSYNVNLSGTNVFQMDKPIGTFARFGRAEFDGNGNFTARTYASYHGQIKPETFSGHYAVVADCRFEMVYASLDDGSGPHDVPAVTWSGMLTDDSRAAFVLVSDPAGMAVVGKLKSQ